MMLLFILSALFPCLVFADNNGLCTKLDPGQYAALDGYTGSPVWSFYGLKRNDDVTLEKDFRWLGRFSPKGTRVTSYDVILHLKFVDHKNRSSSKLSRRYHKTTGKCLASVRSRLRGPYGEFLNIRLAPVDYPDNLAPKLNIIKVSKSFFVRSTAERWEKNPGCSTIIHELLHLTGLVDEYYDPKYRCRHYGPDQSIMSDHERAFYTAGLHWIKKLFRLKSDPSILRPAHFRAITEPGCTDRNPLYYRCIYDAYGQFKRNGGRGCRKNVPKQCLKSNWMDIL
ncbi:MAG: hypothetical protein A2583_12025 [Bdellovibrionales bacterium RIFOXYD1_FULL_53_11]|nr:MAG: hypothetical protein A2583_12025 [Bdellovibrionales bacterium RIFOXYD1_FULL_53_11]